MLYAYLGHHKAATTWITRIFQRGAKIMGLSHVNVHNPSMFNHDLEKFISNEHIHFLSYTNADQRYVNDLEKFRGFHVIRDPRDIVVSAYFSHLYSHPTEHWPELIEHRHKLQSVGEEEGLLMEMDFRRAEFEMMYDWDYSQENVLELRYEDLIQNPYMEFVSIFRFLSILEEGGLGRKWSIKNLYAISTKKGLGKIPVEKVLRIVYDNEFEKLSGGRKKGEIDSKSHFRKGVAGDWKNHFSPNHTEQFKQEYNNLLLKLGYVVV